MGIFFILVIVFGNVVFERFCMLSCLCMFDYSNNIYGRVIEKNVVVL